MVISYVMGILLLVELEWVLLMDELKFSKKKILVALDI